MLFFSETPGYIDEADVFFKDPLAFIYAHYGKSETYPTCDRAHGYGLHNVCQEEPDSWATPSHIVMFDVLWPNVKEFLEQHEFREVCIL